MDDALAQKLVDGLRDAGIDFITYLPETRLSQILPKIFKDKSFTTVTKTRIVAGTTHSARQQVVRLDR